MMNESNRKYWNNRAIREEAMLNEDINKKSKVIVNAYQRSQQYLTDEATKIYRRYLNKSDYNEQEVHQILNTSADIAELTNLKQMITKTGDKAIKKNMQDYLTGLAVKHRITKLDELKAKSYLVSKQLADTQLKESTGFYIDTIHKAYQSAAVESKIAEGVRRIDDGRYHSYNIVDGKAVLEMPNDPKVKVNLAPDKPVEGFKEISSEQTKHILESHWKGSNFSERIWSDTDVLASRLEELFTVKAMTGMSERQMAKEIADQFGVAANVARRLIRTESNYMANQGKLKSWRDHGVENYLIVAVLDLRTSTICRKEDGKIYKVTDAQAGENFPPFHPWCRTIARAYFGSRSIDGERKANDPIAKASFTIDMGTTYKEWEKKLVEDYGVKDWDTENKKVKNHNSDVKQYEQYKKVLDCPPKTFEEFQQMKYNGGRDWELTKLDYKRRTKLMNDPTLALPNAKDATLDDRKFTQYLFGGTTEDGLIKGRLINERLGYNIGNWRGFSKQIKSNAVKYPAKSKGSNAFGESFEQQMILYNKKGIPSNVIVGWKVKDNATHMASAYIKEAKE